MSVCRGHLPLFESSSLCRVRLEFGDGPHHSGEGRGTVELVELVRDRQCRATRLVQGRRQPGSIPRTGVKLYSLLRLGRGGGRGTELHSGPARILTSRPGKDLSQPNGCLIAAAPGPEVAEASVSVLLCRLAAPIGVSFSAQIPVRGRSSTQVSVPVLTRSDTDVLLFDSSRRATGSRINGGVEPMNA